jgi:hypothetical protein
MTAISIRKAGNALREAIAKARRQPMHRTSHSRNGCGKMS